VQRSHTYPKRAVPLAASYGFAISCVGNELQVEIVNSCVNVDTNAPNDLIFKQKLRSEMIKKRSKLVFCMQCVNVNSHQSTNFFRDNLRLHHLLWIATQQKSTIVLYKISTNTSKV